MERCLRSLFGVFIYLIISSVGFAQKSEEIIFELPGLRAPVFLTPGTNYLTVKNLEPGRTYEFVAVGSTYQFTEKYELCFSDKELNDISFKSPYPNSEDRRQIVANSNSTEIIVETKATGSRELVSSYISISCLDCERESDWFEKFVNGAARSATNLTVVENIPPAILINETLIGGTCFDIANISAYGDGRYRGTFDNGMASINIEDGVVLATGRGNGLPGPNNAPNWNGNIPGSNFNAQDPNLATITAGAQRDVNSITFQFTPTTDLVQFEYVFGSEEYCEYVGTPFNDAFGFFISGPGIVGTQNIALLPNGQGVTINNVNHQTNNTFYVNNNGFTNLGVTACVPLGQAAPTFNQLDGWTTVLTAVAELIPCETYTIKLVIADIVDNLWGSAVFLKAGSFNAGGFVFSEPLFPTGSAIIYEGCDGGFIQFGRKGDTSQEEIIEIEIGGTATPGDDYTPIPNPLVFAPGQEIILIPLFAFQDNITEGQETIIITILNACSCDEQELVIIIDELPPIEIELDDVTLCEGETISLNPGVTGGQAPLSYLWSNGSMEPRITISPTETEEYWLVVTDECEGKDSISILVTVVETAEEDLGVFTICEGESVEVGGVTYTSGGVFTTMLSQQNEPFCDSIVTFEIIVLDAEAGTLSFNAINCPGDIVNILVSGFDTDPDNEQYIIITDGNGVIVQITLGGSTTFTHDICETFTVYSFNIDTNAGIVVPGVGEVFDTSICDETCCDIESLPLSFQDDEPPFFLDPPADITLICFELLEDMQTLTFRDNCVSQGTSAGEESGTADTCEGGTITRTWMAEDDCGNSVEHVQVITILPIEEAEFVNPPADQTVACDAVPTSFPALNYTNGESGACLISGSVPAEVEEDYDPLCGGTITVTWTFTDECDREISHEQIITIEPAPEAEFVNAPGDITLNCGEAPETPPALSFTNGQSGDCEISGTVDPEVEGGADICGGEITFTWTYIDDCDREIQHVQVITIEPAAEATFVDAPGDMTVNCADIPTSAPDLEYTNGLSGDCEISGVAVASMSGSADLCGGEITYMWEFTDECGRTTQHTQVITVEPVPEAEFVNAPASVTVDCANIPSEAPDLEYTNGLSGDCEISGVAVASVSGSADLCGGEITYTWEFTDACGRQTQHIQVITVEPVPEAEFVNAPASVTVDCANIPSEAPDLAYTNGLSGDCEISGVAVASVSGSADLCGGAITYTWEFTDVCGRQTQHIQVITVEPVPEAIFVDAPVDITVDCADIPTGAPDLTYTNGLSGDCEISGTITPTVEGQADLCGGIITYRWTFRDECGREIVHTQTITATPVPEAVFINPPTDLQLACGEPIPPSAPLSFSNGLVGACAIEGTVDPTPDNDFDICGDRIIRIWSFTDPCGRMLIHEQTIFILPPPEAQFDNLPGNITVSCENLPIAPILSYTNGATGQCEISGTVEPTQTGSANLCGGVVNYTWSFVDPCGRQISHTQTITVEESPVAAFINPPQDVVLNCGDPIPPAGPLFFANGLSGTCSIEGSVTPTVNGGENLCGATITYLWAFTDACGRAISHSQNIFISEAPPVSFDNPPSDITVNCTEVEINPPILNYSNAATSAGCLIQGFVEAVVTGGYTECGGVITYTWSYIDPCGRPLSHQQNVFVQEAPQAVFTTTPADVTVSCQNLPPQDVGIEVTNSLNEDCGILDTVFPTVTGNYDGCGGVLFYTYQFIDACGRVTEYTQTVTIQREELPVFVDPPADLTVNCSEVSSVLVAQNLTYSNGVNGPCALNGSVSPALLGNWDSCGGELSFYWSTFVCGELLEYTQTITILPAPGPFFPFLPQDITLDCGEPLPDATPLAYSNELSGECLIAGTIIPTLEINEGVAVYTYIFQDDCGNELFHEWVINITDNPDLLINPTEVALCRGESFNLATVSIVDQNNTDPSITWHTALPATTGNQIAIFNVSPTETTTYYIFAQNNDGCFEEVPFTITVFEPVNAGTDGQDAFCFGADNIDLVSYLGPDITPGGQWQDLDNSFVVLTNPSNVSFVNIPAGTYRFRYSLPANGACPADNATVTITIYPEVNIDILGINCAADQETYFVTVNTNGFSLEVSSGIIEDQGNDVVIISGIDTADILIINVFIEDSDCSLELEVDPPNCNCPEILPPVSDGNRSICQGEPIPTLGVTLANDEVVANWFTTPVGGVPILANSTTFTPNVSNPGVYRYYVEAQSIEFPDCRSNPRIPIELIIRAVPVVNNAILEECDEGDGTALFTLTNAVPQINTTPTNVFSFHLTQAEAIAGENEIASPYRNSESPQQTLFVRVTNVGGCFSIAELTLQVLPLMDIQVSTTRPACFNGNNGTATITAAGGTGNFQYSLDGVSWVAGNTFNNLTSGNYTAWVRDEKSCINTLDFTIETGLQMTINTYNQVCDNAGTLSDPDDDFHVITFTVTNNYGNVGTFNLIIGGVIIGNYTYGQAHTITMPADGLVYTLLFVDAVDGCEISRNTNPLNQCSTDCLITISGLSAECQDNGTPSDPSDDTYIITINTTVANGGDDNGFTLFLNGVEVGVFTYGQTVTFEIPADGTSPEILLVDLNDEECTASATLPILVTCSDKCLITAVLDDTLCDPEGTVEDPTDDTFTAFITLSGLNTAGSWYVSGNPGQTYPYGVSTELGPWLIANGNVVLTLVDSDDAECTFILDVTPPEPCSDDCLITFANVQAVCNDNGTPWDPSDDFYQISINVNVLNPGEDNSYIILVNGQPVDTVPYGTTGIVTLPADGSSPVITVIDLNEEDCRRSRTLSPLTPCSDQCLLQGSIVQVDCDDQGTDNDPLDDTFTISVNISGFNLGSGWQLLGFPGTTYNYNENITLGPWLISEGDFEIIIVDQADPSCRLTLSVEAPEPCSSPCVLEWTGLAIGDCDDNNTGPIIDDDFFFVSFVLTAPEGEVTTYSVRFGGNTWGPFNYGELVNIGPLPANGNTLNLQIRDDQNSSCQTTIPVLQAPCSSCDQVMSAGPDQNLTCTVTSLVLQGTSSENGAINWTGPGGFTSTVLQPTVNRPGTYTLTIIYDNGCESTDTVTITEDADVPIADAGPDRVLTCDQPSTILGGSSTSIGPDLRFEWRDENGNLVGTDRILSTDVPGTYTLTVFNDVIGCASAPDMVEVSSNQELPRAPIYADPTDVLDCVVELIVLTSDDDENIVYSWIREGQELIASSISVNTPGVIVLVATDTINGCKNDSRIVIQDGIEYPLIFINDPDPLNCNNAETVIDASMSQSAPEIISSWIGPDGQPLSQTGLIISVSEPGTYTLISRDTINGCENELSIVVDDVSVFPEINAGQDVELSCLDTLNITTLSGSGINLGDQFTIQWSSVQGEILEGGDTFTPTVQGGGLYTLSVLNLVNGCESSDVVRVRPNADAPQINGLQIDSIFCSGDRGGIFISDIQGGNPPINITVNGAPTNNSGTIFPLSPGSYNIRIQDARGCFTDTLIVFEEGRDLSVLLPLSILVTQGDSVEVEATVNIPAEELSLIRWTPAAYVSCDSCLLTTIFPEESDVFRILVIDQNGCEARASVNIFVKKQSNVYIPNGFTPNGDGVNDFFTLYADDTVVRVLEGRIFDRWGSMMYFREDFPPNDPTFGWDGLFRGKPVVPGVYVYSFLVEFDDGRIEPFYGDITVLGN